VHTRMSKTKGTRVHGKANMVVRAAREHVVYKELSIATSKFTTRRVTESRSDTRSGKGSSIG
jgi:hypothetical protein